MILALIKFYVLATVILAAALACAAGCAHPVSHLDPGGNANERARTLNEDIFGHATVIEKQALGESRMRAQLIVQDTVKVSGALADSDKANAAKDSELHDWVKKYWQLHAKWYVWLGQRLQWALAGWIALGIGGTLLSAFTGGWLGWLGGFIIHSIPVSSPWLRARDVLAGQASASGVK